MASVAVTRLEGRGGEVLIGDEHPFAIVGERINPTGRASSPTRSSPAT